MKRIKSELDHIEKINEILILGLQEIIDESNLT
jgi:hypothetical protein